MKLRDYDYIIAIAEEQSISKAAGRLYITQPALSRMLQGVEAELGTPLFRRTGKSLVLTEAGKIYVESAQRIVSISTEMERRLQQAAEDTQGLTLAAPMAYYDFLNAEVFPAFHRALPNTWIHASVIPQRQVAEDLLQHKQQIVFAMADDECRAELAVWPLGSVEIVLAVPADSPLLARATERVGYTYPYIAPEDLTDADFILPNNDSYSGHFAMTYFSAHNISPRVRLTIPRAGMMPELVAGGLGVAMVSSLALRCSEEKRRLRCLSLRPAKEARTLALLCRKDHRLTPAEEAFLGILRGCLAN